MRSAAPSLARPDAGDSRASPPAGLRVVAFALFFAVCVAGLQALVRALVSSFATSAEYEIGIALGFGAHLLVGAVLGTPLWFARTPRGGRMALGASVVAAAIVFALLAAAYHYHALFNRLPTTSALDALRTPGKLGASLEDALPPWVWALEVVVPSASIARLVDPLATRLARARRSLLLLPLALMVSVGLLAPRASSGQRYYGSVHPLVHLLTPSGPPPSVFPPSTSETEVLASIVRARLGARPVLFDPRYPYCTEAPAAPAERAPAQAHSVLLILLEGISNRELAGSYQGKPLMPQLAKLLGEGLSFSRFEAVGDRSSQALFSVLAGVPPETHRRVVTHSHLVSFQGLPRALQGAGFDTWYFHGSDLSFEQQRTLLQRAGFAHVIEPDPRALARSTGWGLSDGEVFAQLERALDEQRERAGDRRQFALVATLSTHDPYHPPPGHARVFTGDDRYSRFAETVRYLDDELAKLCAWYREREKPRGSVLAVVSDHAPRLPAPDDSADTTTGEFEYRFEVPLVLFGSAIDALDPARKRELSTRVGSHADLSPTLLALAGVAQPPCQLGLNLLAPSWPAERWTVSIAGDDMRFLYVNAPPLRWMLPLDRRRPRLYDLDADPMLRRDLFQSSDPRSHAVLGFADAYMRLGAYLNLGDHFAPAGALLPLHAPRPPRAREPLRVISHRGNTAGPPAEGARNQDENSFQAFDRALAAGFTWIELDVQITADEVPIVHHDRVVHAPGGAEVVIAQQTLAALRARGLELPTLQEVFARYAGRASFAVELKPQATWQDSMRLARATLHAVDQRPAGMQIMFDSFSQAIVSTLQRWSKLEVGWDVPQNAPSENAIALAAEQQLDWVYVRHDLATPALVEKLHAAGVRVMLYTLDDPTALRRFGEHQPDGVITDSAAWLTHLASSASSE